VVVIPSDLVGEIQPEVAMVEARDQEAARRILAGAGFAGTMRSLGRA
jgi:hypothetical protein